MIKEPKWAEALKSPVDLDRLEADIAAPPKGGPTPLQIIAHAVSRLTWKDAERMGQGIQAKMAESAPSLTGAVQAWAEEWEQL